MQLPVLHSASWQSSVVKLSVDYRNFATLYHILGTPTGTVTRGGYLRLSASVR